MQATTVYFERPGQENTDDVFRAVKQRAAGLVRADEEVISIAGTGTGTGKEANTAVVLTPVNSHRFFDLKVKEIICKPHF